MIPKALILSGYGINGENEMAEGFRLAGSTPKIVHINDLIDGIENLKNFSIFALSSGFSYGDHTGAGKALANRIINNLKDQLETFIKRDTLILGACNGFQILVQLGLLPAIGSKYFQRQAALLNNTSGRYQCQWIQAKANPNSKCVFTKNIRTINLPIGHGEGRFYMPQKDLEQLQKNNQITLTFCKPNGSPAKMDPAFNPNGSSLDIAGVCDPTGRIFGLMPHPDRSLFFHNNPDWTNQKAILLKKGQPLPEKGTGRIIYENAVEYFK